MTARADAHIHLFREGFVASSPDELTWYDRLRRSAGVTAALVIAYEGDARFHGNSAHILRLAAEHPWIRPTAYIDVAKPPSTTELSAMRAAGFVGWSMYLPESGPSLDAWPLERLAALDGGIVSINATPTALARVTDALAWLDTATVVISHLGLPGDAGRSATGARAALAPLVRLAAREHVFVKLSGLYAIDRRYPHPAAAPSFDVVRDAFGTGRLMWGSDFSPVTGEVDERLAMELPGWIDAELSASEVAAVMGGTLLGQLARVDAVGRITA